MDAAAIAWRAKTSCRSWYSTSIPPGIRRGIRGEGLFTTITEPNDRRRDWGHHGDRGPDRLKKDLPAGWKAP